MSEGLTEDRLHGAAQCAPRSRVRTVALRTVGREPDRRRDADRSLPRCVAQQLRGQPGRHLPEPHHSLVPAPAHLGPDGKLPVLGCRAVIRPGRSCAAVHRDDVGVGGGYADNPRHPDRARRGHRPDAGWCRGVSRRALRRPAQESWRRRPPRPAAHRDAVLDSGAFGPIRPHPRRTPHPLAGVPMGEDCLRLNIYVPASAFDGGAPEPRHGRGSTAEVTAGEPARGPVPSRSRSRTRVSPSSRSIIGLTGSASSRIRRCRRRCRANRSRTTR